MLTAVQELEQKTLAFWNLSQVWNQIHEVDVATGEAICVCTDILQMTNFTRPLSYAADRLLQEIIRGEGEKPHDHPKIVPLRQKA